jgi:RES domain-containing protein
MVDENDLPSTLARIGDVKFDGFGYRVVRFEYLQKVKVANLHPERVLYGLGSVTTGARFTRIGGPSSIYIAEDKMTAEAEANNGLPEPLPPWGTFAIRMRLSSVLDLTDAAVQVQLQTNCIELAAQWRAPQARGLYVPTQALGAAAFYSGRFQAIRYPSVANPTGTCLVVFAARVKAPDHIEVHDPSGTVAERLPR